MFGKSTIAILTIILGVFLIDSSLQAQSLIQRQQGSNSLEIAPPVHRRQPTAPPIVSAPSQHVLVIPSASHDFLGEWGGHLRLENVVGEIDPPDSSIVSLAFGDQGGDVFMRTTAFANPTAQIVDTTAKVVTPRKVTLKLEGMEFSNDPPLRHVERLSLALVNKDTMDCLKYVDFYRPGDSEPIASADYHGTLRLIGDVERHQLEREVEEHGEIPQSTIESRRSFGR